MVEGLASLLDVLIEEEILTQRRRAGESLKLRLQEVDRDLDCTKNALCDLIQVLQQGQHNTPQLQAIIDRYDRHVARLAHLEGRADAIVAKIDELMEQGKDIEALRYYRAEAGVVWDRCHEVIGWWKWAPREHRRDEVMIDLRRAAARNVDATEPEA
jgi:hypothetical protein